MPQEGDDDEQLLFGMDAEHASKMREKLKSNPDYQKQAMEWIAAVIGEPLPSDDVHTALKSGIVLCKLANKIKPNIIRVINTKPLAVCERENIKSYIRACNFIGVPSDELFDVSDLHDKKSINAVIISIYALGRIVQTIETFNGPTLGVRYSVTLEDRQKREEAKEATRKKEQEQYEEYQKERKDRREELEDEKMDRRLKREDTIREKIKGRRIKKGRRVSSGFQRLSANFSVSPVKYGMDSEHQKMMEERQMAADTEYEEKALDWIEEITGEELDDFYKSLKSGVVLCQLANCIQPGIIPKVNKRNLPAVHRENIQLYLNACAKFGITTHEMFTVPDLYDRKMISAVVVNIYALARLVEAKPTIGATLTTKNGKSIMVSKKPTARDSARSLRLSVTIPNSGGASSSRIGNPPSPKSGNAPPSPKFGNGPPSPKFGNANASSSRLGPANASSSRFGNANASSSKLGNANASNSRYSLPKSSRASQSYHAGDNTLAQPLLDPVPPPKPEKSGCCCIIM